MTGADVSHISWLTYAFGFMCGSVGLFVIAVTAALIGERLK